MSETRKRCQEPLYGTVPDTFSFPFPGFDNTEEEAVHLTDIVPFLGGSYEMVADWESLAIVDGRLVTEQNPASSTAAAHALQNNCSN